MLADLSACLDSQVEGPGLSNLVFRPEQWTYVEMSTLVWGSCF